MKLFADPCLIMPNQTKTYCWCYDENLKLFCVLPKSEELSVAAQTLWNAFLKCVPVIQKQKLHDFVWCPNSFDGLIQHCRPQHIWVCIDENLPKRFSDVYYSPSPQAWLQHPQFKKQVWCVWQKILNNVA